MQPNTEKALQLACEWIDNRVDYSENGCKICPLYGKCDYQTYGKENCVPSIMKYFMDKSIV